MLTGKRFKLGTATLGIDTIDGKRVAVTIPAGAILEVIAGPSDGDRMVDVLWEERALVMFAIDVMQRGEEITGQSAAVRAQRPSSAFRALTRGPEPGDGGSLENFLARSHNAQEEGPA